MADRLLSWDLIGRIWFGTFQKEVIMIVGGLGKEELGKEELEPPFRVISVRTMLSGLATIEEAKAAAEQLVPGLLRLAAVEAHGDD